MATSRLINRSVVTASVAALLLVLARGAGLAQAPVWYVQQSVGVQGVTDMDSRDSLRCLVALDSTLFVISKIIKTTDGGVTWRVVLRRYNPDGYIGRVTSVSWPADSLAVATADSGRLLRSTDGGETWDDRRLFDSNSTPYVRMIDGLHGFVYLDYVPEPRTFTTDDGGLTWEPFAVPDPVGYDVRWWVWSRTPAPVRVGPSRFICVREGRGNFTESRLLVTSDRGGTWDTARAAFPGWEAYAPWAFSMRFADSLRGWASMRRDGKWVVSRTTDGGFTWNVVSAEVVTDLQVSPSIMWVGDSSRVTLGSYTNARRSSDGGSTWTDDSAIVAWNDHPDFAPPHPADAWPVFGFNRFNFNQILHFGVPPATTGVTPSTRGRAGLSAGTRIVDLSIDGSLLRLRFVSSGTAPVSIRVFDLLGALRHARDVDGSGGEISAIAIDMAGLPGGLYGVRVVGDGGGAAQVFPLLRR